MPEEIKPYEILIIVTSHDDLASFSVSLASIIFFLTKTESRIEIHTACQPSPSLFFVFLLSVPRIRSRTTTIKRLRDKRAWQLCTKIAKSCSSNHNQYHPPHDPPTATVYSKIYKNGILEAKMFASNAILFEFLILLISFLRIAENLFWNLICKDRFIIVELFHF